MAITGQLPCTEDTSPGTLLSLGYMNIFTKTSPKGRGRGAAFLVYTSSKKHYTSGDVGGFKPADPAKHPSVVDGNHGRCAFSFKRTINALMVNHMNKSCGGLEPK